MSPARATIKMIKMVKVMIFLGMNHRQRLEGTWLDVNNAFLYGDLHEEVYIALPPDFYDKNETKVCKLVKSLYGLKQAPRKWNAKLTCALLENGSKIENFKGFLSSEFMIKDLGKLKYFLGIEVLENQSGICLSQRKYCLELLNEYGLLACKPVATPLQQNIVLSVVETEMDKYLFNMTEYQKLVGKLIYLSITRPDIAYVVHCLSQYMHAPLQSHFGVGLRVLRYLKQAPGTGIQFNKGNMFSLHAYSDAYWAKCLKTRKSVSDHIDLGLGIVLVVLRVCSEDR
ncbi:ribonuclease H-like domain-containing protein, partial [Tanacetum coccineum]